MTQEFEKNLNFSGDSLFKLRITNLIFLTSIYIIIAELNKIQKAFPSHESPFFISIFFWRNACILFKKTRKVGDIFKTKFYGDFVYLHVRYI